VPERRLSLVILANDDSADPRAIARELMTAWPGLLAP
jgi:hypothetical protein